MNWHHTADGQANGPVDHSEIRRLIAARKIGAETLVWRDGMADWEPASEHFSDAFAAMPPPVPWQAQERGQTGRYPDRGREMAREGTSRLVGADGLYMGAPSRSFEEAIRVCFANYVTFSGRASRSEYWYFFLFTTLLGIPGAIIPELALIQLAVLLPSMAVLWRRLHDTDRSGWWVGGPWLGLIAMGLMVGLWMTANPYGRPSDLDGVPLALGALAFIGVNIAVLIFLFLRGTPGPNRFG